MLKKSLRIVAVLMCTINSAFAQLLEDFDPAKLTWTESPSKNIWHIGPIDKRVSTPLQKGSLLGINSYDTYTSTEDVSFNSSAFQVPALNVAAEKMFLEFFSWQLLKSGEYVSIKLSTTDGAIARLYQKITYYSDAQRWVYNSIDITEFAGKEVKMSIILDVAGRTQTSSYLGVYIDHISFRNSSTPAPLPSILNAVQDIAIAKNGVANEKVSFAFQTTGTEPVLKVSSTTPGLVSPDSVKLVKLSNGSYKLNIRPVKEQVGIAELTVSTSTGLHETARTFKVYVSDPQVIVNETFEDPDYMRWTREPAQSQLFSIGGTTLVGKSNPLSERVLGLTLLDQMIASKKQMVKVVSGAVYLPNSDLGTYLLSFKNYREINVCCTVSPKVKIRQENGQETVVLDLKIPDNKKWETETVTLSQFEGQKIQIVFEFESQGFPSESYVGLANGWFMDDVQVLHIGTPITTFKPFAIDNIQDVVQLNLGAGKIPFTVFNPEGQQLAFTLSSSDTAMVKNQSLAVAGQKNQYNLDFKLGAIGETSIKIIAQSPQYTDTAVFRILNPTALNKDSILMIELFDKYGLASLGYNWNTVPMNKWIGVTLSSSGKRIKGLLLNRNFPMHEFPMELTGLDSLESLNLTNGYLYGTIPPEIGNLKALKTLIMNTALTGRFPKEIVQLQKLQTLSLSQNVEIPEEIGALGALQDFTLSSNSVYFIFPKAIFKIKTLKSIYIRTVYGNPSPFPEGISNLVDLESFRCEGDFTGSLSEEIGSLSKLKTLNLSGNKLESLPNSIGDLQNLETLDLQWNPIRSIPASLGKLKKLKTLNLLGTQLSGAVPVQLADLTALESLDLSENALIGPLPETFANLQKLNSFNIARNQITYIPSSVSTIESLGYLYLSDNLLDSIPDYSVSNQSPTIYVGRNYLGFMDFERNPTIYSNDRLQSERPLKLVSAKAGNNVAIDAQVSGKNNVYQWYKNGKILNGQTTKVLNLSNVTVNDQADYQCQVTNTVITGLTIKSSVFKLLILQANNTLPSLRDTVMSIRNDLYHQFQLGFKSKDAEGDSLFYQLLTPQEYFAFNYKYTITANYAVASYGSSDPIVLKVLYFDKRGMSDTLTVTVHVIPRSATFGGYYYYVTEVRDNIPAGTEIYQLQLKASNGEPLIYSSTSAEVAVDSVSGRVTTTAKFIANGEVRNEYKFSLIGKEKNGKIYSFNLTVKMLPAENRVFNFEPKVDNQVIQLIKGADINAVIGKVQGTDFDKDTLLYQLVGTDTRFAVSANGDIKVVVAPLSLPITEYILKVRVYDQKGGNAYAFVTVKVVAMGIIVTTKTLSVNENTSAYTTVGKVIAEELSGAGLKYAIDGDKSKVPFDFMNENNMMLIVVDSSMLDYETTKQFTFNVLITSTNGFSKSAPITITLKDVNEGTISVSDQRVGSLQVYPTLASDFVQVEAKTAIEDIELVDLQGRVVGHWRPNQQRYTLAVSHLESSQYLLRVFDAQGMTQHKLTIAK